MDCRRAEFSDPSGWLKALNLYVPIPTEVSSNETTFALTKTLLVSVFSKFNLIEPESRYEVNVPIKLVLKLFGALSRKYCETFVCVPSFSMNISTKFLSSVV